MVRLTHISGSMQGTSSTSPKAVIRIGRGADCDVRFDATRDSKVSSHHAEIRFDGGSYFLFDTGSSNGTLVNGKKIAKQKLRSGDTLHFGSGGPEVKFEIDNSAFVGFGPPPMAAGYGQAPARKPPPQVGPDQDTKALAQEAQQKIALARAMAGGQSSGQTMFIMADTLQKVETQTKASSGKRWLKVVLGVVCVALLVVGGMGIVIMEQKKQLQAITKKKEGADRQIQKIQLQMQLESDPEKLANLEEQLTLLTGKAQQAIGEMEQKDKNKAAELANQGDELDREIRRILLKFDANTYAVPPLFKERLQHHIDATMKRSNTKQVYARKRQYWPLIVKEFSALGMPEEMAYVAWTESQFDPFAQSAAGARGMWQFIPATARQYGLRVDDNWRSGGHDDRTDVARLTHAAARYLANLLADFGSDSFMLAIASYNKGENGMRKVLRDIAQEPGGFRKEKRDFWHLYRLKKLPEETLEYVPQILAAAIICNNPQKYGLE